MSLLLPHLWTAAATWDWWLCRSGDLSQIGQLNAHARSIQEQLNSGGKATCWIHLLDDLSEQVIVHQTALRLDRDGETVWSGPIFQANESSTAAAAGEAEGQDQLQITAMGWFQILNQRLLHTGAEFQTMIKAANGLAWQEQFGTYFQLGVDTAIQLAYDFTDFSAISDATIIFDLLNRANIDYPTGISVGKIHGAPIGRNLTLQRFQNVGQQITQLTNIEAGCDFRIDPVTRELDLYGPGASDTPAIANGRGIDLGQGMLFSYPGNCTSVSRTQDGTQTTNREETVGQYGTGRDDDLASQAANGLFEATTSLSEVVDPNILIAYANAEVAVKSQPWTVITFVPRAVVQDDKQASGVPRPYKDYNLGDLCYTLIDKGPRFKVGVSGDPQAVRIFGWTMNIDDSGNETIQQVQTSYQGLGS